MPVHNEKFFVLTFSARFCILQDILQLLVKLTIQTSVNIRRVPNKTGRRGQSEHIQFIDFPTIFFEK